VEGVTVLFVHHPTRRTLPPKRLSLGGTDLPVASPTQAFVDLLADPEQAPDLETLCALAARLPLSVRGVLRLAEEISDTVLKRAAYLLAWSGRLGFSRVPFLRFRASPTHLDARLGTGPAVHWDKRFRLFVPASLLELPVEGTPCRASFAALNWLLIRNTPAFRATQSRWGRLVLRRDPEFPAFLRLIEVPSRFRDARDLVGWGRAFGLFPPPDLANPERRRRLRNLLVRILSPRTLASIARLGDRPAFLGSLDREGADFLLTLALILGNRALALAVLASHGERLVDFPGNPGLRRLATDPGMLGGGLDPYVGSVLVRALLVRGEFAAAKALAALIGCPPRRSPEWAWYALARGSALTGPREPAKARRWLLKARDSWARRRARYEVSRAELALGNLCIQHLRPRQAGRHFRAALEACRGLRGLPPGYSGLLLSGRGITLGQRGRFAGAERLLGRAVKLLQRVGNLDAVARVQFVRARLFVFQGLPARADRLLREAFHLRVSQGNLRGQVEVAGQLALVHRLLGHGPGVDYWMGRIPDTSPFHQVYRLIAIGRDHLLQGDLPAACWRLGRASARAGAEGLSVLLQGRASALFLLAERGRREACPRRPIPEIDRLLQREPEECETTWFRLIRGLYGMSPDAGRDVDQAMEELHRRQYFDPFWFLLARDLLLLSRPGSAAYVRFQDRLSPPALRQTARRFLGMNGGDAVLGLLPTLAVSPARPPVAEDQEESGPGSSVPGIDRILQVRSGWVRVVDGEGYRQGRAMERPQDLLDLDLVSGCLSFGRYRASFRPGTTPARLLALLLETHPEKAGVSQVFSAVWGTPMDEEEDLLLVLTTVRRLNAILRRVCPPAGIVVARSEPSQVELVLPPRWQAWLPLATPG